MRLHHIFEEVCSVCEARVLSEEQVGQHTSGQWFEIRKFICGRKVSYSPNFLRIEVIEECPTHPSSVEKFKKRQVLRDLLMDTIENSDVDAEYKRYLSMYLPGR